MRLRPVAYALSASIWLTGCGTTGDNTFMAAATQPAGEAKTSPLMMVGLTTAGDRNKDSYAALFPFYAEICALSEINKKPGFGAEFTSGFGGHSVLYLNGVCRVQDAGYPTIKLCDGDVAGQGVGLSVNDHYKNTNWVATPGKDFLFYGSLAPTDTVTPAGYQRTQAKAMQMGILDGVEFHGRFFDKMPAGTSKRAYMYELSIATDYAVNFGRDRYCARVPMNRGQMQRMVSYLNQINEPYRDRRKEFHWNVLGNNCSHMTHNALAAAGIWNEIDIDEPFFIAAFDFPVPKNEFVNLMQRTNDLDLDDPAALYRDEGLRQNLLLHDSLPLRAGALAEAAPVMPNNTLYETHPRLIFYDPIGRYQRAFEAILADPRYLDLHANLDYFARLYQRVAAERKPVSWYLEKRKVASQDAADFRDFYQRYYDYIGRQSTALEAQIAALNGTPADNNRPLVVGASSGTLPGIPTSDVAAPPAVTP
ncbi:MAG TPA: hypothetical protein VM639_18235 [Dongiaceae bacterium]|nr:hypothetical protein [Dongiaceae bacterium]